MKNLALFFALLCVENVSYACEAELRCWGQDENGTTIRFSVEEQLSKVTLSKQEIPSSDGAATPMPPYSYTKVSEWAIEDISHDDLSLKIEGIYQGVALGQAGQITIRGKTTGIREDNGVHRVFYLADVEILPTTKRVVPRVATFYQVNCESRSHQH